jgi:hypothetical protein
MKTPHRQSMSLKKLSGVQYQQYLNTNFKDCLIIYAPGVSHTYGELKATSVCHNTEEVI